MKTKATHYGTCQVCGHRQKLPNGELSKHGYTTRCGFFEGTCTGSGYLPFEQDKSLIEHAIIAALKQATLFREKAADIRLSTDPNSVTNNCYESDWGKFGFPVRRRGSYFGRSGGYKILNGRVEERTITNPSGYSFQTFLFVAGKYETELRWAGMGSTLSSVVKYLNEKEALELERIAVQADDYVAWQRSRIVGWKPSKLVSIS